MEPVGDVVRPGLHQRMLSNVCHLITVLCVHRHLLLLLLLYGLIITPVLLLIGVHSCRRRRRSHTSP